MCLTCFVGCGKSEDLTKVKVSEVARSLFYAPQYAAINKGYFKDEGLDIELTTAQGADKVTAAVLSGDSDIGFCGPEATIYVKQGGEKDYPVNFAQITKRDGSFLVGRKDDAKSFKYSDLKGKHIIAGRAGGVPEMTLEYVLKKNGLDLKKDVKMDTSIQFAAMAGTFVGGTGDYVALFEPSATEVEANKQGYVLKSIGEESGEVPYTVYNAKKSFIKDNPEIIQKFTNAVQKGLDYVQTASSEEIADQIKDFFPDNDKETLVKVIDRYKDIDAWKDTPVLTKDSFDRLQEIMSEAGQLDKKADYKDLVNTTFAQKAK
ncbi:ABC transporter substrate-binding protein [Anaerofustis stercorihominis]|nr:ABC transporter substrate-binding protein [Anaerofustis stercorihominis]MCR2033020.1 ABC transporter substrate-binding protein [Anaerofustis stercorihominis]